MITFIPRDISMWREYFDFYPPITLTFKEKDRYKVFRNRTELIEFLKQHGVETTDTEFPLTFTHSEDQTLFDWIGRGELFRVSKQLVYGWFRDDLRPYPL